MLICSDFPKFSIEAHDDLLRQWDAVRFENGPLQLDLSAVQLVDPYGLCALVVFLNHLPPEALPVQLQLRGWPSAGLQWSLKPSEHSRSAHNGAARVMERIGRAPLNIAATEGSDAGPVPYLTRMGFWEEVGATLDARPQQFPVRPLWLPDGNALLDITIMHTHDAISVMLRKTGEILQNLNYTVPGRGHVLEVLSELCSNVLMHAQTEFGAVASMQTYKSRGGVRYIVMSIADHGIGVRRSLANNRVLSGRLESDAQALAVSVQPGASRFGSGGHGGGLPRVIEIAKRYGGRVAFRSGTGAFSFNGSTDDKRIFDTSNLPGTQLRIALPETNLRGT
ncbi:MAG: hypothetical protein JWN98_132 [Abditibacteriota bacterium]|nr:hypothetical protein [Abditibacteriota bacterium]